MKFLLEIDTDNAAFLYGNLEMETARILRELADEITTKGANFGKGHKLIDGNGNPVGVAKFIDEDASND